jgi:hypothetical protein
LPRAGRVVTLELEVDLAQPHLPLDVARPRQGRVAHVGFDDVLEGLDASLQRLFVIDGNLLLRRQVEVDVAQPGAVGVEKLRSHGQGVRRGGFGCVGGLVPVECALP